jgi:hypothetical protein
MPRNQHLEPLEESHRSQTPAFSVEEQRRIELLKLQKEVQRRETEQAKWRAASTPTAPGSDRKEPNPSLPNPRIETKKEKNEMGFFARLRHGKLLD